MFRTTSGRSAPRPAAAAETPAPVRRQVPAARAVPSGLTAQAALLCYGDMIADVKALARSWGTGRQDRYSSPRQHTKDCFSIIETTPSALLVLTARSTASNYLYSHSVNTAILTTHLGLGLGWPAGALRRLGFAALLHELCLSELLELPVETGSPAGEESREQRLHPTEVTALRQHLSNLESTLKHMAGEAIPDLRLASHILGICDLYEALSHFRAWREPRLPHAVIRHLVKEYADVFDRKAKQLMLQRLTLYPPGSYVALSHGEIACVTAVDPQSPTLPTVAIRLNGEGAPLDPPQTVNLSEHSLVHIAAPIDETKLGLKDKKTLMALQAERWWVS